MLGAGTTLVILVGAVAAVMQLMSIRKYRHEEPLSTYLVIIVIRVMEVTYRTP